MDPTTNSNIFEEIQKVYFLNEIIFNLIISFLWSTNKFCLQKNS